MRGASKSYDGETALADVSLDLAAGEVHALMGENGAGKSTLIRLLAGVTRPDAMRLEIDGRPVTVRGPQDAARAGLRFIHQELNVVPALSVAENIFLGHEPPRTPLGTVAWRRLARRARETLAGIGAEHVDPRLPMSRLSVGDAMLVSIARAFVEPPGGGEAARVYVMDEPTAALSRRETELLFGVVRGLRARGAAILYVSHRMEEIFELADRITVLRDGRRVTTLAAAEADRAGLIEAMTGRELAAVDRKARAAEGAVGGPVLEVRELSTPALHALSFEVRAGEVVGVAGLAGAGRSELLRALVGADPRTGGRTLVRGRELRARHPVDAWRAGLAFVPEERRAEGLAMDASVARNLLLPHLGRVARAGLADAGRERREARRWADAVGLKARGPRQPVHELSGGNQQKVVLARALAGEPAVLLLDEPSRGVDVGAKADIHRLIRRAAGEGAAVLLASSDLDEVLATCDRVLVLHEGRLVAERPTAELDRGSLLTLCYGEAAA